MQALSTGSPACLLIITVLSLQDLVVRAQLPVFLRLEYSTCISLSFTQNWPPGAGHMPAGFYFGTDAPFKRSGSGTCIFQTFSGQ